MRLTIAAVLLVVLASPGCKKPKPPTPSATTPAVADTPAAPSGGGNTNYQPGAGAAQNVRQAGRRTVALNDMHNLATAIAQWDTENGRMPNRNEILTLLQQYPNIKSLVSDGTIVLTGSTNRSGLWAYEVDADTKGGVGIVSGRAGRMSAEEIKRHLGR